MANLTIRRRTTKKQRALRTAGKAGSAAGKAGSAAIKLLKARIAWLAGKKAAKVVVPAAAVGTAAVVAKKRSGRFHRETASGVDNVRPVAPASPVA